MENKFEKFIYGNYRPSDSYLENLAMALNHINSFMLSEHREDILRRYNVSDKIEAHRNEKYCGMY